MNNLLIEYLRREFHPRGTAPLIEIGFLDGGLDGRAYLDFEFIQSAVTDMEHKLMLSHALGEPISPLEKLAIDLLLSSAYISEPVLFDAALSV